MHEYLYDRILGFIAECGQFQKDIKDREAEIVVLKNEIKVIQDELNLTFDEWFNCKDEKQKEKLEWKRNKVSSPINSKIYRIQGLKKEIKDIEANIIKFIRKGYEPK